MMNCSDNTDGRPEIWKGSQARVVCAVTLNGKSPANDFLNEMKVKEYLKILSLFKRLCEVGRINNKQQFKLVANPIWAFKRFQYRFPCFRNGKDWVLTHGFIKKTDKWSKTEIQKAMRIREEDLTRWNKTQKNK